MDRDVPDVYQPAEDSLLLAETATERVTADDTVLEVGVGSGFVAERVRDATGCRLVGTDINRAACLATRERTVPTVRANLAAPIAADSADVVLCNPPYLPTPPSVEWDDPLELALSGGEDGRRLVRPFLADVSRVLRPDGRAYLLVSSLTGIDEVCACAREHDLATREVAETKIPFERLVVLEITNTHS